MIAIKDESLIPIGDSFGQLTSYFFASLGVDVSTLPTNFLLTGLDPGWRTNESFGWKRRQRRSTKCREQHLATRQSSDKKLSALSVPRQTGALPR